MQTSDRLPAPSDEHLFNLGALDTANGIYVTGIPKDTGTRDLLTMALFHWCQQMPFLLPGEDVNEHLTKVVFVSPVSVDILRKVQSFIAGWLSCFALTQEDTGNGRNFHTTLAGEGPDTQN